MINILLYTGLGLLIFSATGLAYGLVKTKLDQYTLVQNKAVKPRNVKVTQ